MIRAPNVKAPLISSHVVDCACSGKSALCAWHRLLLDLRTFLQLLKAEPQSPLKPHYSLAIIKYHKQEIHSGPTKTCSKKTGLLTCQAKGSEISNLLQLFDQHAMTSNLLAALKNHQGKGVTVTTHPLIEASAVVLRQLANA